MKESLRTNNSLLLREELLNRSGEELLKTSQDFLNKLFDRIGITEKAIPSIVYFKKLDFGYLPNNERLESILTRVIWENNNTFYKKSEEKNILIKISLLVT